MKKYLLPLIIIFILGAGALYILSTSKRTDSGDANQGHNMGAMNQKPVAQSHRSYELEVTSKPVAFEPNTDTVYRFKVKNDKGEVLKDFATVHEKIMHFILVRKDLQNFQHIHPTYDKETGEFSIVINFPTDGPYRLFPDFTPGKSADNPQGLTVTLHDDVNVGDISKYKAQKVISDTTNIKTVDGYTITYNMPSELKAQTEFSYNLEIDKNGQPVTDLENYLGALGHGVILRSDNLDFIHTHAGETKPGSGAMDHSMMTASGEPKNRGPKINFSTSFPEPGTYRVFTQFQHMGKVVTSDYAVVVK